VRIRTKVAVSVTACNMMSSLSVVTCNVYALEGKGRYLSLGKA